MGKLEIKGTFDFSDEKQTELIRENEYWKTPKPKHMLAEHEGFKLYELPDGKVYKHAYGSFYQKDVEDLDIELENVLSLEHKIESTNNTDLIKKCKVKLKEHYKNCVRLIDMDFARGWNRWSENILDMFIEKKTYRVLWGSGNCGKSATMAMLLYIKWRANPSNRMVVIASKVRADSKARVFAYIKNIHAKSPPCVGHKIVVRDSSLQTGIFTQMFIEDEGKWVDNDRGCIVSLPVKTNAKKEEVGANLQGRHPQDKLILNFDEGQELDGKLLGSTVFANWLTNKNVEVNIWGNPTPVDYWNVADYDILFKQGASHLSLDKLKDLEKEAHKTNTWETQDTYVLHLSMMDSPKDDPDEKKYFMDFGYGEGTKKQRLHFLAGKENVELIGRTISATSETWFSQVLGFPYINTSGEKEDTVLNSHMVSQTRSYPLKWMWNPYGGVENSSSKLEWYMGVDPAVTGRGDNASIVCGRVGMMVDGRMGIDLMNGRACRRVKYRQDEDFTDTIINTMESLSKEFGIPLNNIAIETIGSGEVFKYAMNKHIEEGKWQGDVARGLSYNIVDPSEAPSNLWMFRSLGKMVRAYDMCSNKSTELWVAVRCAVLSRQIFNIPDFILKQFYTRLLLKNSRGDKYQVEPKTKMKKRGIHSPDDADALVNMVDLIRKRGFFYKFLDNYNYKDKYGTEYFREQHGANIEKRVQTAIDIILGKRGGGGAGEGGGKKYKNISWGGI